MCAVALPGLIQGLGLRKCSARPMEALSEGLDCVWVAGQGGESKHRPGAKSCGSHERTHLWQDVGCASQLGRDGEGTQGDAVECLTPQDRAPEHPAVE